ncbi:MAG: Asp-tRNA(Asn)/Glu-tRNA(Gln) amidotransferase subunit GatC [Candidatus Jacksonbacteria bacterium]|jgi:aspartyl-tRNA(Asn)/glutamyl-tRNA(Gln) amidotransferase subunit C|nr:Asp-tRNA(Asn)/Glu-tRNA(Gln) amidotransferase subunit GatC [Candidatus Jacksonbacteria bacterium]MBT6300922.1 Asp-tRNA(Asn)/Glu-tRNA(Gln) amidotransferase subunit GatC [Candidatus Jacksonbacteria bacterium]MBT6955263.1 Asp-tRNA(Asn)/Glu-tRNA(Gln) amidotransferase subunit GatC [Candidatus Jacksonbacteria bacterium]MBT7007917.1 Asp-tRNA(Asn)/Glu-tRNA(Gln) amidotransferase subunit GatC [Candidatus Jacksonbacteria bacterium]MBT7338415.1 Asp-tRNA(Asn)/Glu-tRNA(Gln) amidotransferase subunit GatC [C
MELTTKEVQHIAKLARLQLSKEEEKQYQSQLSSILDFVEQLNEVDTKNVEETSQVTGLMNRYREDTVEELSEEQREELLSSVPNKDEDGGVKVKNVF